MTILTLAELLPEVLSLLLLLKYRWSAHLPDPSRSICMLSLLLSLQLFEESKSDSIFLQLTHVDLSSAANCEAALMTIDNVDCVLENVCSRLLSLVYLNGHLHSLNLRHHHALVLCPYILHLPDEMHPLHHSRLCMITVSVLPLAIHGIAINVLFHLCDYLFNLLLILFSLLGNCASGKLGLMILS